jgi:hypothetical protein
MRKRRRGIAPARVREFLLRKVINCYVKTHRRFRT